LTAFLAFDTSTEALSLGVGWHDARGEWQQCLHEAEGGRASSAALVPGAMALLRQAGLDLGQLQAIAFGRGPGSFTGLRTACAVAQGLAWGAGLPVLPLDTLLAVAEDARAREGVRRVVAVLDARMGEVYTAAWEHDGTAWREQTPAALCLPQQVVVPAGFMLAGNAFAAHGSRLPPAAGHIAAWPTAAALLRLAPSRFAAGEAVAPSQALPLYSRDKVAQTTLERAALQALRAGAGVAPELPAARTQP
jgi:tRNA threonylcarbamoyladenosine biosynthesis protein TsaB